MAITKNIPSFSAPYCFALEKSAGAVIYRKQNGQREYLLMQYPHGHWEFPRGHMEAGESEQDTALREIHEETGINDVVLTTGFREMFYFWYVARGKERAERKRQRRGIIIIKKVIFFIAPTHVKEIELSHEHQSHTWSSYEGAIKKLTFANAKNLLTKVEQHLAKETKTD